MQSWWMTLRTSRWYIKLGLVVLIAGLGYYGYNRLVPKKSTMTYQTGTVTKGTLISSIAASGSISSGNTTNIATKASGTVSKVYVKNGDTVKKGQKLLEITLDADGIERRSSAWIEYLKAQEAIVAAVKNKNDLEIQVWKNKQAILDAQDAQDYKNNHTTNPTTHEDYTDAEKNQIDLAVTQAKQTFDVTAEQFKNADARVANARISAQASYRDYQDVSGTIVAPVDGIMNNLTLTEGSTLTASTSQSTSTGSTYASSQTIGFIRSANNEYLAKVSLTEADVIKVKAGQKVTITMDAHEGKTFTGKVLAVDVSGSASSGVTSYPATIVMDATDLPIYPNMTVAATIITNTETDVLMVPTTAITTETDGTMTVQVMKNGTPQQTVVTTGSSNDTSTVILGGLSEGDTIVTGSSTSLKNSNTSSAFSSTNRQNSTRTGGAVMMGGPGF